MRAVLAVLALGLALEIKVRGKKSWTAAQNLSANITPFFVTDEDPNHKYKLEVRYTFGDETPKEHKAEFAGTLEEVNDFLETKTFKLESESVENVLVDVSVHKPGHAQIGKAASALKVYHQVPLEQLLSEVSNRAVFPIKIAKVLPPFSEVPMEPIRHKEAYAGFTLQKVGPYIEFDPQYINEAFNVVFSFPEESTNLRSPQIGLHVEVPLNPHLLNDGTITFKKLLTPKYLLFTLSSGLVILFLFGIVIDTLFCRPRKAKAVVVAAPVVTMPIAVRPAPIVRTSPVRMEAREAYQP